MRLFKIYSFSNFHVCNATLSPMITMLCIGPLGRVHLTTATLYPRPAPRFFSPSPTSYQALFASASFTCLDPSQKWDCAVFVFIWLTSLSILPTRSTDDVGNGRISFFSWLNNVVSCVCVYTHTHIYIHTHTYTHTCHHTHTHICIRYPLVCSQTLRLLFPYLGYSEQNDLPH